MYLFGDLLVSRLFVLSSLLKTQNIDNILDGEASKRVTQPLDSSGAMLIDYSQERGQLFVILKLGRALQVRPQLRCSDGAILRAESASELSVYLHLACNRSGYWAAGIRGQWLYLFERSCQLLSARVIVAKRC